MNSVKHLLFYMKLFNYLFCNMFGSVLECHELTGVSLLWTRRAMPCTALLGGPLLEGKSPMITDWHTAGSSVSQLSQWTRLSPWLTLSTKDINTSFWHYNKWFWFSSNQIKVTKHACTSSWLPLAHTIHHTYHHVITMNKQQNRQKL